MNNMRIPESVAERNVHLAAELYTARSAARTLLGERYAAKMSEFGLPIQAVMSRDKCDTLKAAITVCKEFHLDGMDALLVLAAAVELIEPSA